MSGKYWYASATSAEDAEEKQYDSGHILLKEVDLNGGSKIPWIIRTALFDILTAFGVVAGGECFIAVMTDLHINAIYARYLYLLVVLFMAPFSVMKCHIIWKARFTVKEGMFDSVDLYNVRRIRYGKHKVYLDRYCIPYVPKPKVLINSIADYFEELTGGVMI